MSSSGKSGSESAGTSSWDTSSSSSSDDEAVLENIRLQLMCDTWVQCEKPECQKWRRVHKDTVKDLGDLSWYCYMNNDNKHNTCTQKEEDYREWEKLAKQYGIGVRIANLTGGTLVWAKMAGYAWWPAIVVPDQERGVVAIYDDYTGEPLFFHLEFFGEKHSHGWIARKQIEVFTDTTPPDAGTSSKGKVVATKGKPVQKGKKGKAAKVSRRSCRPPKKSYHGSSVEFAICECSALLHCDTGVRLASCRFKFDHQVKVPKPLNEEDAGIKNRKRKSNTQQPKKRRKTSTSQDQTTSKMDNSKITPNNETTHSPERPSKVQDKAGTSEIPPESAEQNIFHTPEQIPCDDEGDGSELGGPVGSPLWVKGMKKLEEKLNKSASMVNRTKQEKYSLDVLTYHRNEQAFDQAVRKLMLRRGVKMRPLPCWENVQVTLFPLFLAIYDRGGFHNVCKNRHWSQIYSDIIGTKCVCQRNTRLKAIYQMYLLPYENYIKANEEQERKNMEKQKSLAVLQSIQPSTVSENGSSTGDSGVKMNVHFYDNTPETDKQYEVVNTASEFGQQQLPETAAAAQADCGSSESDSDKNVYHDMQVLQQEIHSLEQQIKGYEEDC